MVRCTLRGVAGVTAEAANGQRFGVAVPFHYKSWALPQLQAILHASALSCWGKAGLVH